MRQNTIDEIVKDLKRILNDKKYRKKLDDIKNNWLEISVDKVVSNVLEFFDSLQIVSV